MVVFGWEVVCLIKYIGNIQMLIDHRESRTEGRG